MVNIISCSLTSNLEPVSKMEAFDSFSLDKSAISIATRAAQRKIDAIAEKCGKFLKTPASKSFVKPEEMRKSVYALLQRHLENQKAIVKLESTLKEQGEKYKAEKNGVPVTDSNCMTVIKAIAKERVDLLQTRFIKKKLEAVCNSIRSILKCNACLKPLKLPKVVGYCGHVICKTCVNQINEKILIQILKDKAAIKKYPVIPDISGRVCPVRGCEHLLLGWGFFSHSLKNIADLFSDQPVRRQLSLIPNDDSETPDFREHEALLISAATDFILGEIAARSITNKFKRPDQRAFFRLKILLGVNRIFLHSCCSILEKQGRLIPVVTGIEYELQSQLSPGSEPKKIVVAVHPSGRCVFQSLR